MDTLLSRTGHIYTYVALRRAPGALGVPLPHYSYLVWPFKAILGRHALDTVHLKRVILFADVTSLNDAVMSCVMSQHRMCAGHMSIYYKRATNTSVGVIACCSSVCQVQLYHQRPVCGWCLTHVGHDASSTSLGRSLLLSTVIIVLALVNSAVSPMRTHKYLNKTQECRSTPC